MTINAVVGRNILEPEGPVCLPDDTVYVVEMAKERACVSLVDKKGTRTEIGRGGGRPNGLAIDGDGRLWIAGGENETLVCMSKSGKVLRRYTGPSIDPYLWPNDLAFGPNGLLYMTDSGILPDDLIDGQKIRSDYRGCDYNGRVFEINPETGDILRILDTDIKFTNGIAFDSSSNLYVNETISGNIYRYDNLAAKQPNRTIYGNVIANHDGSFKGPDGMAFGSDGKLYCAVFGQGDITVLDGSGAVSDRIKTNGMRPTNIAFRTHRHAAVVTDLGQCELEELPMACKGLELHAPHLNIDSSN